MKKRILVVAAMAVVAIAAAVVVYAQLFNLNPSTRLRGFEEVPAISTNGNGQFNARIHQGFIEWELFYGQLESPVTQAHVHFGQKDVNGGISFFLCSNLPNPPAGTQPCPPNGGFIRGITMPTDIIGPAGQGIEPGAFNEVLEAMRAGNTYANIHTIRFPNGEIRGQINGEDHNNHINGENGSIIR